MGFLNCLQFSHDIWHRAMSHDPSLLANTEMLLLHSITINPAYYHILLVDHFKSLTWIFYKLFTFTLASFNFLGVCYSHQKLNLFVFL